MRIHSISSVCCLHSCCRQIKTIFIRNLRVLKNYGYLLICVRAVIVTTSSAFFFPQQPSWKIEFFGISRDFSRTSLDLQNVTFQKPSVIILATCSKYFFLVERLSSLGKVKENHKNSRLNIYCSWLNQICNPIRMYVLFTGRKIHIQITCVLFHSDLQYSQQRVRELLRIICMCVGVRVYVCIFRFSTTFNNLFTASKFSFTLV